MQCNAMQKMDSEYSTNSKTDYSKCNTPSVVHFSRNKQGTDESFVRQVLDDGDLTTEPKTKGLEETVGHSQNFAEKMKAKLLNVLDTRDLAKDILTINWESNTEDLVQNAHEFSDALKERLQKVIEKTKRKQTRRQRDTLVRHTKKVSPSIKSHNFAESLKVKHHNTLSQEELNKPSANVQFIESLKRSFETIVDECVENNKHKGNLSDFVSVYDSVPLAKVFRISDNDTLGASIGTKHPEKFQCKFCLENFVHISNLISHVKTHSGDKPYQCKICAKNFSNALHLSLHRSEHSDDKPFSCKYCPKKFAYLTELMSHVKTHKGDKAFQCDLCGRYFHQHSRLKSHFKMHTRPFRCEVCGNSYKEQIELARHLKQHLGCKPFQCPICDETFMQRPLLIAHIKTHDSEKE